MSEAELRVRVLLFGGCRELVGVPELNLTLPHGSIVSDLLDRLRAAAGNFPETVAVAVNRRYASLGEPLGPGDEVAIIPPVTGG